MSHTVSEFNSSNGLKVFLDCCEKGQLDEIRDLICNPLYRTAAGHIGLDRQAYNEGVQ